MIIQANKLREGDVINHMNAEFRITRTPIPSTFDNSKIIVGVERVQKVYGGLLNGLSNHLTSFRCDPEKEIVIKLSLKK